MKSNISRRSVPSTRSQMALACGQLRHVVLIQGSGASAHTSARFVVTVTPVTSVIREIPSEVFLSPLDGMPRECAINLDYIQHDR